MNRCTAKWNERELETYTYRHIGKLAEAMYGIPETELHYSLLGSQIETSAGIIDCLFMVEGLLYIVEFKAVIASEKAIGQLQRYRAAIERQTFFGVLEEQDVSAFVYGLVLAELKPSIQLCLVAPEFTKEAVLGADLCVRTHEESGEFHYELVSSADEIHRDKEQLKMAMLPWVQTLIDYGKYREALAV